VQESLKMYNVIDQRSSSHVNAIRQPVTERTAGTLTPHTLSASKVPPQVRLHQRTVQEHR